VAAVFSFLGWLLQPPAAEWHHVLLHLHLLLLLQHHRLLQRHRLLQHPADRSSAANPQAIAAST